MSVQVNEIFYSIQGESIHAGLPCVFVRLTGCNLRCHYCDTTYAFDEGRPMSVSQIVARVGRFGNRLVEVTGGEPLLQDATPTLVKELIAAGHQVLMETNGSLDIDRVDRRCSRIMDIKCPSSGVDGANNPDNLARLTANDQVKFVIGDRNDYLFARRILPSLPSILVPERVLFSAVFGQLASEQLARWILQDRLAVRLQVQLHKLIWPDRDKGV